MASSLFLLVAVWAVCAPTEGAVRPSSPDEFRKMLLWAQRAADRNLKRGEPIPPFPSSDQLNEVDKEWEKAHRKEDRYDNDLISPPRPYVESSNFRTSHSFPETESGTLTTTQQPRTVADKKIAAPSKKIEFNSTARKSSKDITPDHEASGTEEPIHYSEKSRDVVVSLPRNATPSAPPPYWSHSLLVDELTDPLSAGRLPAHEEYDRNQRYSHSILHGFSTAF